jgi:hypothetical protein
MCNISSRPLEQFSLGQPILEGGVSIALVVKKQPLVRQVVPQYSIIFEGSSSPMIY